MVMALFSKIFFRSAQPWNLQFTLQKVANLLLQDT